MREVLNGITMGIVVLTKEGTVTFANRFCREREMIIRDWEGKKYYEVFRSLELIGFVNELLEGRPATSEFEHSGRVYRVSPLGEYSLQIEDITDLRRFERVQKEFTAAVSHELGTPLAAVKGLLETALLKEVPDKEILEKALKRVGDLERLINSLRLLVLLDTGHRALKERIPLKSLVEEVIGDLGEEITKRKLEVELIGEEILIESDKEKLYILLRNLIENAVTYNREGGRVTVRILKTPEGTRVLVEDTGKGIPEDEIPFIFQPFFGGKNRKGMGLGLAIAKRIADFLGAELNIKSKRGKGTTAEVQLP